MSAPAEEAGAATPESDVVLHLFDWRFRDAMRELGRIAAEGFGAIQLSPPQRSVASGEWWGRYQPLDHTRIEGPLGSERELRELIAAAHACQPPLRVIIDVVLNHMAQACEERKTLTYPRFGPEHFHPRAAIDWASIDSIRIGWVGYGPDLPDLRTELPYVRAEARRYLELLLDCGADGFRFDAVKHIEPEFFAEVLAGLPPGLILYGEYVLQAGHMPVMRQYLPQMRLMDFALLQTMTAAFSPRGDLRALRDPAGASGALPDHCGVGFVTNHDLELGEYGGFGLPRDAVALGHATVVTRPECLPLIWKAHRRDPVVQAAIKLRRLARAHGRTIALDTARVQAWRCGEHGAVVLNAGTDAVRLSLAACGLRCGVATDLLTGATLRGDVTVAPRRPALVVAGDGAHAGDESSGSSLRQS